MTLKSYQNFIGIDIGKYEVVMAVDGIGTIHSYSNDASGWDELYQAHRSCLETGLVVIETTGGYELGLLLYLCDLGIAVHRANTRQVKSFIRSYGSLAKTDALDAKALARYGKERFMRLVLYKPASKNSFALYELCQRRQDLIKMLVQEKNRMQAPRSQSIVKASCQALIALLKQQTVEIDQEIQQLIDKNPALKERQKVLMTVPGIGLVVARSLICLMPELGSLDRKQVASLAGLAPHPRDSGTKVGLRRIKGGRTEIRNALYMSAMAARNSHSGLAKFYAKLIGCGKKKMVALTALMRKIIVIANARVKESLVDKNLKLTT